MKNLYKTALAVFILFSLNGCSIDETGTALSDLDSPSECEQSGGKFCDIDANQVELELIITNTGNPVRSEATTGSCGGVSPSGPNSGIYCFDIAGTCNEAGLASAVIVGRAFGGSEVLGTCTRGRFRVQYQHTFTASEFCLEHNLELELIGKRIDNTEVRNPSRARKSIFIAAATENHPDCAP